MLLENRETPTLCSQITFLALLAIRIRVRVRLARIVRFSLGIALIIARIRFSDFLGAFWRCAAETTRLKGVHLAGEGI